jgi:hypothetical protein
MAPEQKQITVRLPLWLYATLLAYKDQTGIAPATMVRSWAILHGLMLNEGNEPSGAMGQLPPLLPPEDPRSGASDDYTGPGFSPEVYRRYGLEPPDERPDE